MERFRHGRVLFAGDSAHGVSPFGARGANSGVQDADNLAWKLAAVLQGEAPDALLDSYASEREYAADENIRNSTRATDFITPKSEVSRLFRDAVLELAKRHAFARTLVNSGRLSVPATLRDSPLNTPDARCLRRPRWCPAPRPPMRRWSRADGSARLAAARTAGGDALHRAGVRRRRSRPTRSRGRGAAAARRAACTSCGVAARRCAGDSPPSATTRSPAPSTCCAPTSMSARAGAQPDADARARRAATARWPCA